MNEHAEIQGGGAVSPAGTADAAVQDRRLLRGARTRRKVARHGVDIASLEGLNGLSIGQLAADLGLSKSGVQTLFKTKENLQLAVAELASEEFQAAVVRPAQSAEPGVRRFRELTERWISYAAEPLFAGGCFWAASLPEFDSRPGKVRDLLIKQHRAWLNVLAGELRHAMDAGEIAPVDADLAAFQVDAALNSANIALRMGQTGAVDMVRRVIGGFTAPPR